MLLLSFSIYIILSPQAQLERKGAVKKFCSELLSRMGGYREKEITLDQIELTNVTDNLSEGIESENISIAHKLQVVIDASLRKPHEIPQCKSSLSNSLKYELTLAEQTGKRGALLEDIYQMLYIVTPTSVEAERVFSSAAYLCNKLRTRLNDTSIDTLCFIRNNQKNLN